MTDYLNAVLDRANAIRPRPVALFQSYAGRRPVQSEAPADVQTTSEVQPVTPRRPNRPPETTRPLSSPGEGTPEQGQPVPSPVADTTDAVTPLNNRAGLLSSEASGELAPMAETRKPADGVERLQPALVPVLSEPRDQVQTGILLPRPPSESSRGTTHQSGADQESAPTIRVTIGRIEVRAVTAERRPPAQSTSEKRRPSLLLDDYLKRRNGGQG